MAAQKASPLWLQKANIIRNSFLEGAKM